MNISIVGAGNVAWHMAQALEGAGHFITEVYSRDPQNARQLVGKLYDSAVQPDLNYSESTADLFLISVSDDALNDVMQRIVLPERSLVAHTSGSRSLASLREMVDLYSDVPLRTGVFYPLQTFTMGLALNMGNVPFCIEANEEEVEQTLIKLAQSISNSVYRLDSTDRLVLHVAAVFANNFTNHLLSIAYDLASFKEIDFEILKPLISQTYNKALANTDPLRGQTGPSKRGDWEVINQHLELLQSIKPEWAQLYRQLSDSIRERHFNP